MSAETKSTLDTVLRIGERLGVPLLILAALLWMAREAGMAVYGGAVVPVVKAHTTFLESTQETLRGIETTQARQAETMEEIVTGQREITAIIKDDQRRN
jgi:hypothetical protein